MNNTMILVPHEDREYDSKEAVLADWESGKSFINVSTFSHYGGDYVTKGMMHDINMNIKFFFCKCTKWFYLEIK